MHLLLPKRSDSYLIANNVPKPSLRISLCNDLIIISTLKWFGAAGAPPLPAFGNCCRGGWAMFYRLLTIRAHLQRHARHRTERNGTYDATGSSQALDRWHLYVVR